MINDSGSVVNGNYIEILDQQVLAFSDMPSVANYLVISLFRIQVILRQNLDLDKCSSCHLLFMIN